jgi:hypothetical protein
VLESKIFGVFKPDGVVKEALERMENAWLSRKQNHTATRICRLNVAEAVHNRREASVACWFG